MGCGKSKHDVASDNTTILQRKKSGVTFKENETETKDINNNVDNVSSGVEVEQKESESIKDNETETKDIHINIHKTLQFPIQLTLSFIELSDDVYLPLISKSYVTLNMQQF